MFLWTDFSLGFRSPFLLYMSINCCLGGRYCAHSFILCFPLYFFKGIELLSSWQLIILWIRLILLRLFFKPLLGWPSSSLLSRYLLINCGLSRITIEWFFSSQVGWNSYISFLVRTLEVICFIDPLLFHYLAVVLWLT